MRRVYTVPIVNANLEKDKPENQMYRVISKSSSKLDQLAVARRENERYERKFAGVDTSEPKHVTVDDIMQTGVLQAANAGPEQLQRWRKDHIPKDDFREASGI